MVQMNFIFVIISSSDPNLLRKKLVKKNNNKKTMALGAIELQMDMFLVWNHMSWKCDSQVLKINEKWFTVPIL